MKKIITFLICFILTGSLTAQEITGAWYGSLNISGNILNLIFHLKKSDNGYTTTMDSPQQGATGIPMEKTAFDHGVLTVEAPNFGLKYTGTFLPDSNIISGTFSQKGQHFPMTLTRAAPAAKAAGRIQDPVDFPYKQEEVTFMNAEAGVKLAGTLTLPATGSASKIVVLISGSGPQNRNEEIGAINHRPFLVLSDWLTRQGIAVLRYDDRGVGQSTGDFGRATTADFADDAAAAVRYIHSRADLKQMSVGLIGHSEGGAIAPMVAGRDKTIKFIVLLAAPGIAADQLMLQQNKDVSRLMGLSADAIERSAATNTKIYAAVKQYKELPQRTFDDKMDSIVRMEISSYPASALMGANVNDVVRQTAAPLKSPWTRYFLTFDPAPYLSKVHCPVLALNGMLDCQVAYASNLEGIRKNLQKAGNKQFEIVPMEGLNHLFQKAETGSPAAYNTTEETINPAVLQKITSWIKGI